jgi:recombination protein RecR
MAAPEIENLIGLLAKLPGLGPRSARRTALYLLKRRDSMMTPLAHLLEVTAAAVKTCSSCGTLDSTDPCTICADPGRDGSQICVVEEVGDLWALDRGGSFKGRYHVLGGVLSALDGIGPEDLNISRLVARVGDGDVKEVVLALSATVDGQTTAHYIGERLAASGVLVTRLAHGVPVGGELDYLDDGTLTAALKARRPV